MSAEDELDINIPSFAPGHGSIDPDEPSPAAVVDETGADAGDDLAWLSALFGDEAEESEVGSDESEVTLETPIEADPGDPIPPPPTFHLEPPSELVAPPAGANGLTGSRLIPAQPETATEPLTGASDPLPTDRASRPDAGSLTRHRLERDGFREEILATFSILYAKHPKK